MSDPAELGKPVPGHAGKINGYSTDAALVVDAFRVGVGTSIERRAQGDLAAAYQRLNEQLAVVSLELRNSLLTVRNAAFLIEVKQHDPAVVKKARLIIEGQVGQMTGFIDDLIDISLIGSGRTPSRTSSRATY